MKIILVDEGSGLNFEDSVIDYDFLPHSLAGL